MQIFDVESPEFRPYGRVIKGYDLDDLFKTMEEKTPCPEDGTVYVTGDANLEALPICKELSEGIYGFMPIQIGYCNGHNTKLNALEYHRDSEINIALDEVILILAKQDEVSDDFKLDTSKAKAFRVPARSMVEVYATSMHYAPCGPDNSGFRVAIVLPKGTNEALPKKPEALCGEEKLLTAVNKWLIGHPEGGCAEGTHIGLTGKNLDVLE